MTAIKEIESKLSGIANLFGVVLLSFIGHMPEEKVAVEKGHVLTKTRLTKSLTRDLLFIHNENCEYQLDKDTLTKIYKSFLV